MPIFRLSGSVLVYQIDQAISLEYLRPLLIFVLVLTNFIIVHLNMSCVFTDAWSNVGREIEDISNL